MDKIKKYHFDFRKDQLDNIINALAYMIDFAPMNRLYYEDLQDLQTYIENNKIL